MNICCTWFDPSELPAGEGPVDERTLFGIVVLLLERDDAEALRTTSFMIRSMDLRFRSGELSIWSSEGTQLAYKDTMTFRSGLLEALPE